MLYATWHLHIYSPKNYGKTEVTAEKSAGLNAPSSFLIPGCPFRKAPPPPHTHTQNFDTACKRRDVFRALSSSGADAHESCCHLAGSVQTSPPLYLQYVKRQYREKSRIKAPTRRVLALRGGNRGCNPIIETLCPTLGGDWRACGVRVCLR